MQNREAAEHVTDTLLGLAKLVMSSVRKIDAMHTEGKVSSEEATLYRQRALDTVDKMLNENLTPIFERHPELMPKCACCETPHEDAEPD